MKTILHVKKEDFPTYFDFSREQIVELSKFTDAPAIEYQESIRRNLLYELQCLYVDRTTGKQQWHIVELHDLIGAFLGCSDVVVEDK